MMEKIANNNDIPFYDMTTSDTFDNPSYFNDIMHLNDEGARLYSSYMVTLLKDYE